MRTDEAMWVPDNTHVRGPNVCLPKTTRAGLEKRINPARKNE